MLDRTPMPADARRDGGRGPLPDALPTRAPGPDPAPLPRLRRGGLGRAAVAGGVAAGIWAGMTGPAHWADPATWIFGAAAVAAVATLSVGIRPAGAAAPRGRRAGRLSIPGALRLLVWFAGRAAVGAVDVARRAVDPRLPVAPGWYRHPLRLPPGAPRLVMANAITLLPGTLTAELHEGGTQGDHLILHLLDARSDPDPDLRALEARVRGLFGLPDPAAAAGRGRTHPGPERPGRPPFETRHAAGPTAPPHAAVRSLEAP